MCEVAKKSDRPFDWVGVAVGRGTVHTPLEPRLQSPGLISASCKLGLIYAYVIGGKFRQRLGALRYSNDSFLCCFKAAIKHSRRKEGKRTEKKVFSSIPLFQQIKLSNNI